MNLTKLFETQKILRDRINYKGEDRFDKLVLALLVELGECANEWRGFKFWSKDQEPRTKKWIGMEYKDNEHGGIDPIHGTDKYSNPLLEEYVDGLHFVLEIGIEMNITPIACDIYLKADYVNSQFIGLFHAVSQLNINRTKGSYYSLLEIYVGLGEMLGFTWEQIEQAYYDKNKINHERQENGY